MTFPLRSLSATTPFWSGDVIWEVAASFVPVVGSHSLALQPFRNFEVPARYWIATNISTRLGSLVLCLLVRVGKLLISDRVVGALAFVPQIALLTVVLAVKGAGILV